MKMKNLFVAAMMAFGGSAMIAQGAYVSFNLGYAMPAAKEQIGTNLNTNTNGESTITANYGTFGGGLPINLRAGYMLNENFGVELGFGYFIGSKVTTDDDKDEQAKTTDLVETKSSQIRVMPALLVTTANDGLNLYARTGLMLPVGGKTITNYTGTASYPSPIGDVKTEAEYESKGSFSLGFVGAFGVNYSLSDNLSIFGELEGINLKIKSKTTSMTKLMVNGENKLADQDVINKETEYVDEVGPNDNADVNKPYKALADYANYNSFGINVGVKMKF